MPRHARRARRLGRLADTLERAAARQRTILILSLAAIAMLTIALIGLLAFLRR